MPADKRSAVEGPLNLLKEAVKTQNMADIDRYTDEINRVMSDLYQSMSGQGGPQGPQYGPQGGPGYGPQGGDPGYGPQGGPQGPEAPDEQ